MFCPNCGQQIPEGSIFCPACGANLQYQSPNANNMSEQSYQPFSMERDPNSIAAKIRNMLSSKLFLAICIMLSISAIPIGGLPVFPILFTVGAWITYAKARSSDATMQLSGLSMISGTMTASFVLKWIAVGMCALGGIMLFATGPVIASLSGWEEVVESEEFLKALEAEASLLTGDEREMFYKFMDYFVDNIGIVFTVTAVVVIVYAVILAIYNAVFYSKFRRFAKNMGAAYLTNNPTVLNFKGISGLLMAVGIIAIVSNALMLFAGGSTMAVTAICGNVAFILASVWVNKLQESFEAPAVYSGFNAEYQQHYNEQ